MPMTVSRHPVDAIFHASSDAIHRCLREKANLLDDGVVDTLGSVGATSGIHNAVFHQHLGQRAKSLAQHIAVDLADQPTSHFDKCGSQPFAKGARPYTCFLAVLAAPQSEPGLTRSG